MRHRRGRLALGASTLASALTLAGCGDYDPETRAAGGTGSTVTGMLAAAGQSALAGAGGGAGQAGMSGTGMSGAGAGGNGAAAAGGASGSGGSGTAAVTPVEADCDAVEACGGDLVGTWAVAGSCLPVSGMADMAGFGLGCTAAPVTGTLEVSGTWTANADGSFTDETTTSGDSSIELPAECLNVSGTTTTCDRLGGALQALGYASVTCVDAASGGGCSCSATAQQTGGLAMLVFGAASSGTYAVADNVVTTSTPTGSNTEYAYCVSETGSAMVMTPRTIGKTGALTGTIAFAKL